MRLHFHNLTALGGHDRGYAFHVAAADGSRAKPPLGSDVYEIKNSPAAVAEDNRHCFMVVTPDSYIVAQKQSYSKAVEAAEAHADLQYEYADVDPLAFAIIPCVHHSLAGRRNS